MLRNSSTKSDQCRQARRCETANGASNRGLTPVRQARVTINNQREAEQQNASEDGFESGPWIREIETWTTHLRSFLTLSRLVANMLWCAIMVCSIDETICSACDTRINKHKSGSAIQNESTRGHAIRCRNQRQALSGEHEVTGQWNQKAAAPQQASMTRDRPCNAAHNEHMQPKSEPQATAHGAKGKCQAHGRNHGLPFRRPRRLSVPQLRARPAPRPAAPPPLR